MTFPAMTLGRLFVLIALVITIVLLVMGRLEFLGVGVTLLLLEVGVLVG